MQSLLALSAALTFAVWVSDSVHRTSAGSWQSAPVFEFLK
jgi:hypothetical protein